jgi:hypothetical protein
VPSGAGLRRQARRVGGGSGVNRHTARASPLRVRGGTKAGGRREAGDVSKLPRSGYVGQSGDSVVEEHCGEQHHDHRPEQPRVANQPVPDAPEKPRSPVP